MSCTLMSDDHSRTDTAGEKTTGGMMNSADAEYEIEKLEWEIDHYRELLIDDKRSSKALSEELAAAQQQKDNAGQQVQKLQGELDRIKVSAQEHETKSAGLQETIASLNAAIDELRTTHQRHDADVDNLQETVEQHTNTIGQLESQLAAAKTELAQKKQAENELRQKVNKMKKELGTQRSSNAKTQQSLRRLDRRRVRAVAICVDLSGSVSSSGLIEGVKKFYAHLLRHLQQATCKTYVMTVVHGPGGKARVKSTFGSPWSAHVNALMCEQPDGSEAYIGCLRKIREVTLRNEIFLADLQVVLIGDGNALGDTSADTKSICEEFSSNSPPVSIHSVVVQEGTGAGKPRLLPGVGWLVNGMPWYTWDYSSRTKGNDIYWGQNSPLPGLDGLLF